ncbi:hypothetical protein [Chloroflexus sp.]|uniref:hypothetical protein n=1 Tax=Chloroflexus sp. TaxID=1904827 RepID=UPI002ACD4A9F|nr:hypothetical protein [Chloroflexus sp.]
MEELFDFEMEVSSFQIDQVEPGWYTARLIDIEPGPTVEGRRTLRWVFQLTDGRQVTCLTSTRWNATGARKSKSVRIVEAILGRSVQSSEDWRTVIREALGGECRVRVAQRITRGGLARPVVEEVVPA